MVVKLAQIDATTKDQQGQAHNRSQAWKIASQRRS
jgi:hypothetical protein